MGKALIRNPIWPNDQELIQMGQWAPCPRWSVLGSPAASASTPAPNASAALSRLSPLTVQPSTADPATLDGEADVTLTPAASQTADLEAATAAALTMALKRASRGLKG